MNLGERAHAAVPVRRLLMFLLGVVCLAAGLVGPATAGASPRVIFYGHHGILPPHNPIRSLSPHPDFLASPSCRGGKDGAACNKLEREAVAWARQSLEHLGAMRFKVAAYLRLDKVEQLFVLTNIERVVRRLKPVTALSRHLDLRAQAAAKAGVDPSLAGLVGSKISGSGIVVSAGANWASGYDNPLGSDYGWMYDDGPGGADGECNRTNTGCWGHRDNILGTYVSAGSCASGTSEMVMGAGYVGHGVADGDSETELFAGVCGKAPSDIVFTWTKAKRLLGLG